MPIDFIGLRHIAILATGFIALAWLIDQVVARPGIALLIKGVLFVISAAIVTHKFGLLHSTASVRVAPAGEAGTKPRVVAAE
jgi:hypothetical protein